MDAKQVNVLEVLDAAIGDVMAAQVSGVAVDSCVSDMGKARKAIAELIAERDRLRWQREVMEKVLLVQLKHVHQQFDSLLREE